MGRTIPSITFRIEEKMRRWSRFAKLLNEEERKAFLELTAIVKNRRSAIDALDEADINMAILVAAVTEMKGEINVLRRTVEKEGRAENGFSRIGQGD